MNKLPFITSLSLLFLVINTTLLILLNKDIIASIEVNKYAYLVIIVYFSVILGYIFARLIKK